MMHGAYSVNLPHTFSWCAEYQIKFYFIHYPNLTVMCPSYFVSNMYSTHFLLIICLKVNMFYLLRDCNSITLPFSAILKVT